MSLASTQINIITPSVVANLRFQIQLSFIEDLVVDACFQYNVSFKSHIVPIT